MGTTTNLSLTYPESTDLVTNGATAMQTIATGVDGFYGAWTAYTPTATNVTGGTYAAAFRKLGKIGIARVAITAGTATGAAAVTLTLPAGWTANGNYGGAAFHSAVGLKTFGISGTVITIYNGTAVANFAAGNSLAGIRLQFLIELT